MSDDLGDRMKAYEAVEAQRRLDPTLPMLARLDGRSFSSFTRGLARPFDPRLSGLMMDTTRHLLGAFNAQIGYTQSDEITLVWAPFQEPATPPFGGRVQKLTSVLASEATAFFMAEKGGRIPQKAVRRAAFDCRVWSVPSEAEAVNAVIWRQLDARKNSISSAARAHFSHKALDRKSGEEMVAMLAEKGAPWGDLPRYFRHGTLFQRERVIRPFTTAEIDDLPPMHEARRNPGLMVERWIYQEIDGPPSFSSTPRTSPPADPPST